MATMPRYPALFQINTRVLLNRLSRESGKRITLADINDATFDGFAEQGFDWIWLLSVWQTGAAGRAVSRGNPQWRAEFQAILSDLTADDICGSGFAITAYTVSDALGGETALAQFRKKLARRGIKLLLDFVPNHTVPTTRGSRPAQTIISRAAKRRWRTRRRITCGSRPTAEPRSWPTAVIRIFRVGPIPCSSTTPIPTCRRRGSMN